VHVRGVEGGIQPEFLAAGQPASHAGVGWEEFTDAVIQALNTHRKGIVYMLWGKYAQNKGAIIDTEKNLVLKSGHPSPYSANLFFGNHHFSKCNQYLKSQGLSEIDWH
jgi:uracil-DNA glycosylase